MDATATLDLTAADLRPGDVIVNHHGVRYCAAYDVDTTAEDGVHVYTAVRDQEGGLPPVIVYADAAEPVRVTRRA